MRRLHLIIGKNCRVGISVTDGNKSLCRRGSRGSFAMAVTYSDHAATLSSEYKEYKALRPLRLLHVAFLPRVDVQTTLNN